MRWIRRLIVALALIEAGWLAFDGSRALAMGDYVTPSSGEYAGQLGPWAEVVKSVGIEPRSTVMKLIHVTLGVIGLATTTLFVLRIPRATIAMFVFAILCLWYLPFGTLLSVLQIVLLCFVAWRDTPRRPT